MSSEVSKSATRQALRYHFKLSYTKIALVTGSSTSAVKQTVINSRCVDRSAKTWLSRSTEERHRAILEAQKLLKKRKVA